MPTEETYGCGSNEWMSMIDIYPILVHKYGFFELIIFDRANGVFSYSTKKCSKGLLQATTSKVCITHMLGKNISLKETLICVFLSSHYYEVIAMNEDVNTNINWMICSRARQNIFPPFSFAPQVRYQINFKYIQLIYYKALHSWSYMFHQMKHKKCWIIKILHHLIQL